jgi:hypothetical protein
LGGGCEDARLPAREGAHVRHDHLELLRRFAEVPQPSPLSAFIEAVRALSDDPAPENVNRYLAVSRALEESRGLK